MISGSSDADLIGVPDSAEASNNPLHSTTDSDLCRMTTVDESHGIMMGQSSSIAYAGTPTRAKTLSRRRSVSSPTKITAGTSTSSYASSASSFRTRPHVPQSTTSRSQTIEEVASGDAMGLNMSLDAGMARVRRWIKSRRPQDKSTTLLTYSWNSSSNQQRHATSPSASSGTSEEHGNDGYQEDDDILDLSGSGTLFFNVQSNHSRQRALSEPDGDRIRDILYCRAFTNSQEQSSRNRGRSVEFIAMSSRHLDAPSSEAIYTPTRVSVRGLHEAGTFHDAINHGVDIEARTLTTSQRVGMISSRMNSIAEVPAQPASQQDPDPFRDARNRWIVINRRFQQIIKVVALIFGLLLFAILVCWVVLTSSYVISIDKSCDVPLKIYYWVVTGQLIMDVFRADIMRLFFRWDASSNQRIPGRVIAYNIFYLTYALLVLRMGLQSVFFDDEMTCSMTAPELYQSSAVFVALTIAAWATIILGYLVPFCVVATLLTLNGYTPASNQHDDSQGGSPFTVFPSVFGAPPGCVDEMPIVFLEEFPAHYPMECCICMENFTGSEIIVETGCHHVFHKSCCRDWLRQARTCPVCRTDVPTALGMSEDAEEGERSESGDRWGLAGGTSSIHHEVVRMLQALRGRTRQQSTVYTAEHEG